MDNAKAFALGAANRGNPMRVFDWDKAARILRLKGVRNAEAGLEGDMEWTGGHILRDGIPVPRTDAYTYLASTWATPILVIGDESIECWRWQSESPGWDAGTYWPSSARAIFAALGKEVKP